MDFKKLTNMWAEGTRNVTRINISRARAESERKKHKGQVVVVKGQIHDSESDDEPEEDITVLQKADISEEEDMTLSPKLSPVVCNSKSSMNRMKSQSVSGALNVVSNVHFFQSQQDLSSGAEFEPNVRLTQVSPVFVSSRSDHDVRSPRLDRLDRPEVLENREHIRMTQYEELFQNILTGEPMKELAEMEQSLEYLPDHDSPREPEDQSICMPNVNFSDTLEYISTTENPDTETELCKFERG